MLKIAAGSFIAAWALFALIWLTGNIAWDNRWLWGPPGLLGVSCFLGFGGWDHEEHRVPLLLLGAASFCFLLMYFIFYLFVFAYSGY